MFTALTAIVSILLLPVSGLTGLTVSEFEEDIICACGCYKLLSNCDCGVAEEMRERIEKMIAGGIEEKERVSKKEIISKLQEIYGEEILATPPKEGIFAGLWIYPVLVISAGIVVVGLLLKRRDARWYGDPDENINEYDSDTGDGGSERV
jgi:cytochrome c-type biogenesis protein CcmH